MSGDTEASARDETLTGDESWLRLVGKTGEAPAYSPVYRMRLNGPVPSGLTALPLDPRPPWTARGEAIMEGRWRFGTSKVDTPPDRAPWGPAFPSRHFADRIHRFHWLRDVASLGAAGEGRVRSLTVSWIDTFGKWDAFAWRIGCTADRVINLVSAGPWLVGGLEEAAREALLDSLARQARHLSISMSDEPDPIGRFRAAIALVLCGSLQGEGAKLRELGLEKLQEECALQILPDGGHASRSAEALAEALIDLSATEELLLRQGEAAPVFLSRLQQRMAPMLSFLTAADGRLLVGNGGGEGRPGLAAAALAPFGAPAARFSFARLSGFQRVQAEDLRLYLDTGAGPDPRLGGRSCAGALAIVVDDGEDRLITACGASPDTEPAAREASRRTAAHSVLSIEGEDSSIFTSEPLTGLRAPEGPSSISARRLEENDQFLLEAQHAGWRVRHGLVYRRRLYVAKNGARIIGEDSLSRPTTEAAPASTQGIPFVIRFHLHPDVQVAPGPDARTAFLGLPRRERIWRFRSEALLSIEDSRYWGRGGSEASRQLVVAGTAEADADGSRPPNRVRWALSRVEPGVAGE